MSGSSCPLYDWNGNKLNPHIDKHIEKQYNKLLEATDILRKYGTIAHTHTQAHTSDRRKHSEDDTDTHTRTHTHDDNADDKLMSIPRIVMGDDDKAHTDTHTYTESDGKVFQVSHTHAHANTHTTTRIHTYLLLLLT